MRHPADNILHVKIAEIKTASEGYLKATLGSCVGIASIDYNSGLCGLAHCLLPCAPPEAQSRDARFVDRALPNLLRAIGVETRGKADLGAFLGGGARMMPETHIRQTTVGGMNIEAATATFKAHRIPFTVLEVGGTQACTMLVDCKSMTVTSGRIDSMGKD
jgi:chemotaxis protein CheD